MANTKVAEFDDSIDIEEESKKIMKSKKYKEVKKDLLDQLAKVGTDTPVFISMVETYMDFYLTKELCAMDIKRRGIVVPYQNGVLQSGTTDNPSIDKMVKANVQMIKILNSLKINAKSNTVGEDKVTDVDEL